MPKKDGEDYLISEDGNWNVASDYSKLKIMKPLYLCDEYSNISMYGHSTLIEEMENGNMEISELRLRGLKRLITTLIQVIDNSYFAIKGKDDIKELEKHRETLKKALTIFPIFFKVLKGRHGNIIKIDEEKFMKILDEIQEIKYKINVPLNKNNLIFTSKEEFDPSKAKSNLKERMVTQG